MDPTYIGEYRVVRRLGAGGMGEVFLAEHPRLPRRDAVKLLSPQFSGNEQFAARFRREADVLAGLAHPNIVTIHDRGEHEGRLWLAMEYVDGADAAQVLRERGPLPAATVAEIVDRVGSALDAAWEARGITHRDVKPANILLGFRSATGGERLATVKLVDFGIAKAGDEASALTATGVAVGTMAYLSPEAVEGKPVDNRADLYSLACAAFELLTGTPPYDRATASAIMMAHLTAPVPDPTERVPGLPAGLAPVFRTALAKDPRARYASCADFAAAFRGALVAPAPVSRPTVPPPVAPGPPPGYGSPPGFGARPGYGTNPGPVAQPGYPHTLVGTPPPPARPDPRYATPPPPSPAPSGGGRKGLLIGVVAGGAVVAVALAAVLVLRSGGDGAPGTVVTHTATATAGGGTPPSGGPTATAPTMSGTDAYGFTGSPARCAGGETLELAMLTTGSGSGGGSKIVICGSGGDYTYRGARAAGDNSGLTLTATATGSGYYRAVNPNPGGQTKNDYVYTVSPASGLTITRGDGRAVAVEPVSSVWTR